MPRSASVVGLAKRGVIPRKQFYIKLFLFNTVILVLLCYKYRCLLGLPARETRRLIWKGEMGVVRANIQTVEDIYQLVWTAIASKRPIEAVYKGLPRLFCPHRLGRNRGGEMRVLCYQYGGESESGLEAPGSPANWRCTALEKFSRVKLREDPWRTAPNHSRPASCVIEADIDAEDQPAGLDPQKGQ
jgi:hypothetical protein